MSSKPLLFPKMRHPYIVCAGGQTRALLVCQENGPGEANPRGFAAGCFLVVLVRNPGLCENKRFAPDVERDQRFEVYHTVSLFLHIEHGKEKLGLGIIWEAAAA